MIISASRRTDLPAAHASWLFKRFGEGFAWVRNPMNFRQVSRVSLRPEDVDGIVFWTKNPAPMLDRLDELEAYPSYFQYTLTGYGSEIEPGLPPHGERLDTFLRLSQRLGAERVLWRYDPILMGGRYCAAWHERTFRKLAEQLRGSTGQVTISFVDTYARNRARLARLDMQPISTQEMQSLAASLSGIARENGMEICACCEGVDLQPFGVRPARCVDARRLSTIGGFALKEARDPNQRPHCGCAPSVDIGAYDTCPNGCVYCYATSSPAAVRTRLAQCDPDSPLLCGRLSPEDRVTERRGVSLREEQLRMQF